MPKRHSHDRLPEDEELEPVDAISHVSREAQIENMRELRALQNAIAGAHIERDERIYALTLSNVLSRRDMARATGQSVSRIGQIVRERADAQQAGWNAQGAALVARHTVGAPTGSRRPPLGTPNGYEDQARLIAAFERWRAAHVAHGEWDRAAIALDQARLSLVDGELQLITPHHLGDDVRVLSRLRSALMLLRAHHGVDGVTVLGVTADAIHLGIDRRGIADADQFIAQLAEAIDRLGPVLTILSPGAI